MKANWLITAIAFAAVPSMKAAPDFRTDVLPILEQRCAGCHGAERQKSGYRLDSRASALTAGDSGSAAITPAHPEKSSLLRHVTGEGDEAFMPPPKSGVPALTAAQVSTLRAWIEGGAPWPEGVPVVARMQIEKAEPPHWSYLPIKRPPLPMKGTHPIDAFVDARLARAGIVPNPKADALTLVRRLHLDLTGLPPSPEEVAAFLAKPDTASLVDRLLGSPRYGECWARHWLDVVRFAESNGFEMNRARPNAWPYRDYVIRAFNDDLPYDQFIRQQLAGDQLGADEATGFLVAGSWDQVKGQDPVLRANQRADELHDMVSTVGSVFLATTLGCARCHDHKFDPVPQTDYYRIRAVLEGVQHGERPMRPKDDEQRCARAMQLEGRIAALDRQLAQFQSRSQVGRRVLVDDSAAPPGRDADAGCVAIEQPTNGQPVTYSPGRERGQANDPGDSAHLPNLGVSYRYWKREGDHPRDLFTWAPAVAGRFRIWISWGTWTTHARDARYVLDVDGDLTTPGDQTEIARVDQASFADGTPAVPGQKRWSGFWGAGVFELSAHSLVILREGKDHGPTVADAVLFEEAAADGTRSGAGLPHLRPPVTHAANTELFNAVDAKFVRLEVLACSTTQPCIDEFEIFTAGPDSRNVALAKLGARASAADVYLDGASAIHQVAHLNDGRYGNEHSWIGKHARTWVQIELPGVQRIGRIVWSRDREPPAKSRRTYTDRLAVRYEIKASVDGVNWTVIASSADRLGQSYRDVVQDIPTLSSVPAVQRGAVARLSGDRVRLQTEATSLTAYPLAYAGRFEQPPATHRLYRGDPMEPREEIAPGTLSRIGERLDFSADMPEAERRMELANWLASPRNPLTARVIVNRLWQYHFGRGLVETPSDFGRNGAVPSDPDLLDWLAAELIDSGWSLKHIQRLIVTSAAFQRSSEIRPDAAKRDADARLLWRFPARRLDAEALRDSILAVTGKLDLAMGGPGFDLFEPNDNYVKVYTPRQQFAPDTFRRMVYQNKPRMQLDDTFGAFDCPDGGQIAPKRNRSTTPLQALNLMNSAFLWQQANLFADRLKATPSAAVEDRIVTAFQLAFNRRPRPEELSAAKAMTDAHGLPMLCRALFNASEFVYLP